MLGSMDVMVSEDKGQATLVIDKHEKLLENGNVYKPNQQDG